MMRKLTLITMDVIGILSKHKPTKDNLLNILQDLQDSHPQNYLPKDVLLQVAKHLNMTQSWVYGVVGYYSMLSTKPRGHFIVRICNSPVCHISGSENIMKSASEILKVGIGETTPDNLFTIEESECLGRCGKGPSMMINREFYGELTNEKLKQIFSSLKKSVETK